MIGFDEAIELLAGVAGPLGTERVPLDQADGRVLAEPVLAGIASPRTDVSTMDGYAVASAPAGASARVIGESFPGAGFAGEVRQGEAVRIFTGAPTPEGAGRVIIQENVDRDGDAILIREVGKNGNLRRAGSDFTVGEQLVGTGAVLGPRSLVAAAAADRAEVTVYRRPRMKLIATGDELVDPGVAGTRPDAVPESVSFGVAAMARRWGAETVGKERLKDDLGTMRRAAEAALAGADLVVVTGGASVGDRDFARAMFGEELVLIFSKVAIKPGKPVWLGRVGEIVVLGLPGNPTSAMVTARLFLAPLLAGMSGRNPDTALTWAPVPLAQPVGPAGDRETFSRARIEEGRLVLLENQESGAQRTLVSADLLARRPAGVRSYSAGDWVDTLPF